METREKRYQSHRKVVPKKAPPIKKYAPQPKKKKTTPKKVSKPKKQKRFRLKFKNIGLFVLGLFLFIAIFYGIWKMPITNIYIEGNHYLNDQTILEQSGLDHYPSFISTFSGKIQKKLEEEPLIKSVHIKRGFRSITLKIEENRPLYYYESTKHTVLENKKETDDNFQVPTLINYVPDTIYSDFHKKMAKINLDVLERISEIKYDPDEVDTGRFLLSMRDGNYVYLTLTKWDALNSYVNIMKEFPNQRGILYLNAGNSFEVLERW